jgi:Cdc6-like AAA superfamily ATPase
MSKLLKVMKSSVQEKIKYVAKLLIFDPLFMELVNMIEECRLKSKISFEARCLFITGITGSGKTTLANRIQAKHPRRVAKEGTTVPVLVSTIFAPATVKGIVTGLLYSLGDPLADKGTTTSKTLRLYHLIKQCGVELIILDEFQHLYDRDSNRVLIDASDWLKNLINATNVPIILLGMPWGTRILDMNTQLKRRFSAEQELTPFSWSTPEDQKYLMKFLNAVDKQLPFEKRSEFGSEDMAFRFMCASRGKRSAIMLIIRHAAESAIKTGAKCISLEMLARAYKAEIASQRLRAANPFIVHRDKLKVEPITHADAEYTMPKREREQKSLKKASGF